MRRAKHVNERDLAPDAISAIVDANVRETVEYVYNRSPFYRQRLEKAGIEPAGVSRAADLLRIPPTTKEELARHSADFLSVKKTQIADIVTTSGTTGEPLAYPLTRGDVERLAVNEHLSFECTGIVPGDTVLVAVTLDKCIMAGLAYYEGIKHLGATAVRVGSASPAMLIDMAGRLGATAIVSVPSFLDRVADYAAAQSVDLAALGVRRLVCIGEPVRTQGFAPNALARQIAGAWGANVYSTYGATEIASSMCECEEGRGGHAHPSLFYAEILDDNDNPVEPGRTGELVVTTFGVEAMPLVRFKTGDVAFMVDERCPCGRHTPRLGPILGRKNERLKLKGTTVFPAAVYNILNDVEAVRDYVLVVTSDGALVDRLEVVVDCGSTCERLRTEISERLRGGLRVTPDVTMADGEGISRIRCDEGYRKKRLLVDRRDAARGDRD